MGLTDKLLLVAILLMICLLCMAVINYLSARQRQAAAVEEARLNRILITELRNFPRRVPPSMTDLSDEEMFT